MMRVVVKVFFIFFHMLHYKVNNLKALSANCKRHFQLNVIHSYCKYHITVYQMYRINELRGQSDNIV